MSYVALAVLYVALAVLVGRVCSLNGRLEGTIVYEPAVTRPAPAKRAVESGPRAGATGARPVEAPEGARPPHEVPAVH